MHGRIMCLYNGINVILSFLMISLKTAPLFSLHGQYKISTFLIHNFQPPCLYSSVCVELGRKPHCWFSHNAAQIENTDEYRCTLSKHYEITPKQYTEKFLVVKMKIFIGFFFFFFFFFLLKT